MCGIVGIRRFDDTRVDAARLAHMRDRLEHRGPDDYGEWLRDGVGLAHRRLSIIDLAGSRQPMSAGPLHVCFNGEIFNYRALRESLAGDFQFQTQGDTEVLLALHRRYGASGVERLNGQYAYALYDEQRQSLWLHRDRLGVLPLYYFWDGRVFAFASEIKALLPALDALPELDPESLKEYLAYRSVPAPHTLFRSIRKLPPGHTLHLDKAGALTIEPYWQVPNEDPAAGPHASISDADAIERVEAALVEAVSSRMVADVPVGAYLSGGVDSSLIVALMSKGERAAVETFSAGFDDPRYDELPYARAVSEQLGTRHHEVVVKPGDFEELWHGLTWHRDAPISEPADIALHRLAERARGSVKVLLSGEGSDELFGGYPKHAYERWARRATLVPASLRAAVVPALERALPQSLARGRVMLRAIGAAGEADRFQTWFAPFTRGERTALLPGVPERDGHREISARARGDALQRMLYADCHTWLVDNLLERGDRMSMAASVESRPPFMDHRLVELAFSLPSRVKVRGRSGKWVVKEVARRHLPASIVDRPKVGFRVPLDAWFRGGLREMSADLLLSRDSFVGGTLDRTSIRRLLAVHESGRRNEEIRIWTLLCLEVWHRVFLRPSDREVGARP